MALPFEETQVTTLRTGYFRYVTDLTGVFVTERMNLAGFSRFNANVVVNFQAAGLGYVLCRTQGFVMNSALYDDPFLIHPPEYQTNSLYTTSFQKAYSCTDWDYVTMSFIVVDYAWATDDLEINLTVNMTATGV